MINCGDGYFGVFAYCVSECDDVVTEFVNGYT